MSMLADRKRKIRWSDDPNGLRWAQDSNTFGKKMMEKMGWQGGGLGKNEDGKQDFIRLSVKTDVAGVGHSQTSDREHLRNVATGLDDVLASLQGDSVQAPAGVSKPKFSLLEASKERGTRFHYRKMVAAKDVAHRINEIILTTGEEKVPQNSTEVKCSKDYFSLKFQSGGKIESTFEANSEPDAQLNGKKAKKSRDRPSTDVAVENPADLVDVKPKKKKIFYSIEMERSGPDGLHLKLSSNAGADVDAYLEYRRIVGDDDGGILFSQEQYDEYKKTVVARRMENRLFVSWTATPTNMDCKLIGPETPCFCGHRYKQHATDFSTIPKERPIQLPCRIKGCRCTSYHFVPMNGGQPVRCTCKHMAEEHVESMPFSCQKMGCKCSGFYTSFSCECGLPASKHLTIIETKEERLAQGKPIGRDTPYQAMGGLTGFSSLAAGYMRMDPSGIGAPTAEVLDAPITANDHPFLRANVRSVNAYRQQAITSASGSKEQNEQELTEMMSQMRRPGESELDYYERRYQERQKQSKIYRGPPKKKS